MRLDVDFINAVVRHADPLDYFEEGYYRFKWTGYKPAIGSLMLHAQWTAFPADYFGTRRAMYFNVAVNAEPLMDIKIDPSSDYKRLDEFVDRRDNALYRLRKLLAFAHVAELASDCTAGAVSRALRGPKFLTTDLQPGGVPDLMLDMDRAINETLGW